MEMKHSVLKLAAVISAFALGGVTSALAQNTGGGTVGGSVTPINTLAGTPNNSITIGPSTPGGSNALSGVTVVSGTIDNNSATGWRLTVTSGNTGKLKKGGGGAGREILYQNVEFVATGAGTLGAGLTSPDTQNKDITTGNGDTGGSAGTILFNTGAHVGTHATATTATVGYAYALKISTSNDATLLAGVYSDTLSLTLDNDP